MLGLVPPFFFPFFVPLRIGSPDWISLFTFTFHFSLSLFHFSLFTFTFLFFFFLFFSCSSSCICSCFLTSCSRGPRRWRTKWRILCPPSRLARLLIHLDDGLLTLICCDCAVNGNPCTEHLQRVLDAGQHPVRGECKSSAAR